MKEFELSKIDPISAGKISAAMYAVLGLLIVLLYAPFAVIAIALSGDLAIALGGLIFGIIGGLIGIVFYAVVGFVLGALMTYFYNFIADRFGGLEVEFEER